MGTGLLVAGTAIFYQGTQTRELKRQVVASQQDNAALQALFSRADFELRSAIDSLSNELAQARLESGASLAKAQNAALKSNPSASIVER